MAKHRRGALGHTAQKHSEYAHNMLDAYEQSVHRARQFARDGQCMRAVSEAVNAAWLRGGADSQAGSGRVRAKEGGLPTRFSRGGPGIAEEALEYVFARCARR